MEYVGPQFYRGRVTSREDGGKIKITMRDEEVLEMVQLADYADVKVCCADCL